MDLIELGVVLSAFFVDGAGPSHDQLDIAFARSDLSKGDPAPLRAGQRQLIGKTKRVRGVYLYASDAAMGPQGLTLARELTSQLRGEGSFTRSLKDKYAGAEKITQLQTAFADWGYTLDDNGALRPTIIDNLTGTELTAALRALVNRINVNPLDAQLQIGTGKDLDEAAARQVLIDKLGDYPIGGRPGSFPVTLSAAFTALGLALPPDVNLDTDPHRQVQQALFLLGNAINRLRNDAGSGHGRPDGPRKTRPLTVAEARLVARSTALLAGLLLDALDE